MHARCLAATATFTFFVTAALSEELRATADALAPLTFGFTLFTMLSREHATWLSVPATYATAFGFAWAYGRLVTALAAPGLVPRWLAARIHQQVRRNQGLSSRSALGAGSLMSFAVCLIVHYAQRPLREATRVCVGLAFLSYMAQTAGYIALRRAGRKGALARAATSRSPFGVAGAYASLLVWALGLLSVLGFQDSGFVELAVLAGGLLVLVVYYATYAVHHQVISADERGVVLAAATAPRAGPQHTQETAPTTGSRPGSTPPTAKDRAASEATEGSLRGPSAHTSSGSLRMPQLVRADSKLNDLLEEHPGFTDDMDEPYVANWPPAVLPLSAPSPSSSPSRRDLVRTGDREDPTTALIAAGLASGSTPEGCRSAPLRRAGSDSAIASSVMTAPVVGAPQPPATNASPAPTVPRRGSLLRGGAFGQPFLVRHGRLERLREETDRDLRSAMSGIWSEPSQHWSHGRAS